MRRLLLLITLIIAGHFAMAQEAPEGLFINSKAADFRAKDQFGNMIRLKDLLKKGKVVLIFTGDTGVRIATGFKKLEDSLQLIKDKGAMLVAVTPEIPESISKTIEQTRAEYSILFDEELKIMNAYKVDFELPENTVTRYRNTGIKLEEINGKNGNNLPIPAIYIIDKDANITYRFFNADYKKRPSVKEILDNLK